MRSKRVKKASKTLSDFVIDSTLGSADDVTSEQEHCYNKYFQVIDNPLEELKRRFSELSCDIMIGISALNPASDKFLDYDNLIKMATHYSVESKNLQNELFQFKRLLQRKRDKGVCVNTPIDLAEVLEPYRDAFFDLHKLVNISLTLPVTSASCERSFSKLKLIKTPLRSSSGHERTSDIAVLSVNEQRTKQLDINYVIDLFAVNHQNRRIVLK